MRAQIALDTALPCFGQRAPCPAFPQILLADAHPLMRSALAQVATHACPGASIIEVETLEQALSILRQGFDIALVLLDLHLPDTLDFNGLRAIRNRFPGTPVAIVSATEDALTVHEAMEQGAAGFIPKSARIADLTQAIAAIHAGEIWTPGTAPDQPSRLGEAGLTPAQMRVMAALKRGLLNKQIAFELGVTEHTVKAHITAAFRKLGVTHRMQAMRVLQQ